MLRPHPSRAPVGVRTASTTHRSHARRGVLGNECDGLAVSNSSGEDAIAIYEAAFSKPGS